MSKQGSSKYNPSSAPYAYQNTGKSDGRTAHGNNTDTLVKDNIVRRQCHIPTLCGCTWGPVQYTTNLLPGWRLWELRFWYSLCPVGDVSKHA